MRDRAVHVAGPQPQHGRVEIGAPFSEQKLLEAAKRQRAPAAAFELVDKFLSRQDGSRRKSFL